MKVIPFFLAALLITTASWASSLPITPFEAYYKVFGKGIHIGDSELVLIDDGQGSYRMSSHVYPIGFAALVTKESIREQVNGHFRNGAPHPLLYQQQRKGKKSRDIRLNFDWKNSRLQAQSNKEQATLSLMPRIVDPLSLHLLVMSDLKQGRNAKEYTLVKETKLKTYEIKHEGKERLDTPLGHLDTWRVSRHRPGSSRTTILWFAPSLNYLPVQITQKKNGKENLRMMIEKVKGITVESSP